MFKKIIPIIVIIFVSCSTQKSNIVNTNSERKSTKINDVFADKDTDKKLESSVLSNPVIDEAEINPKNTIVQDTVKPKNINVVKDTINRIPDEFIEGNQVPKSVQDIQSANNTVVLAATSTVKVTKDMVTAYIQKYKQVAKDEMLRYNIPASITLAQAILESGCGTGVLALKSNNHFGIKCKDDWKGETVKYDDDAQNECFRKYDSPYLSFEDHSVFLTSRPWYNSLFKLPKNDYKGWAYGLKKAGFATDSKYPEKLIAIIESNNLNQIDDEVLGKPSIAISKEENKDIPIEKSKIQTITNSENTYTVQPKEGLYAISKKFNTTVDELKKLNNLTDNNISVGQVLKIK